jgi:beta-galactosidase
MKLRYLNEKETMKPTSGKISKHFAISRRKFVQSCTLGTIGLASGSIMGCLTTKKASVQNGPANRIIPLDQDWLFGREFNPASLSSHFDDSAFLPVTLPHCVTDLSWQDWHPDAWQHVWGYRRHFTIPKELKGLRIFLQFDGVMVGAAPTINDHKLPPHLGGYLPFKYEITDWLKEGDNVLAIAVDSRWSNVPPQGSPSGAKRIDYLEAGGIHRSVRLQAVPQIFISDVFAKPVRVLDADRLIEISCTIDTVILSVKPVLIRVEMKQGDRVVSRIQKTLRIEKTGLVEVTLSLSDLKDIILWDVDNPQLYYIVTTLLIEGKPLHDYHTRIGLREARFELDGFFLNSRRLQLFGLNRHEIFPYVGFAMPERVMRKDAEILRHEFNCNIARCSHYPQTEGFLNACDELGLMVWEEVPGWGYLGDEAWKELLVRDVKDMIIRDRNHPSIIIWGTRVNESSNEVELYLRTKALARTLDDSRPGSGSMTPDSRKNWEQDWHEDVFAFDDYHADPDGSVGILEPTEGFPYMLAEAVGQFNYTTGKGFDSMYRRTAEAKVQQQ